MRVRDIMTQPAQTCGVHADLRTVSRRFKDTGVGMLVILDAHGRIDGVITDRDVALALDHPRDHAANLPVSIAATRQVRTCRSSDDVHEALATMAASRVRRLPVLGTDGSLDGVISVDDIILWAAQGAIGSRELALALRSIVAPRTVVTEPELPRF